MSKRILVVDDEQHIRMLMEQTLEDFEEKDVEIYFAKDGNEALRAIKQFSPDLIYLDAMMPEINGYDVCKIIKTDSTFKKSYVVMVTAKGQEFDKKKGAEVGADLYITKPFDPEFIIKKTEEILDIKL